MQYVPYIFPDNSVFPALVFNFDDLIYLVELNKCFTNSGVPEQ